jgi:membrane protein
MSPMAGRLRKYVADRIKTLYEWANDLTWGIPGIVRDAIQHFDEADAAEATASVAYYALFSLFPILLVLVTAGSFVLESDQVQQWVLDFVLVAFPVAQRLIERNIEGILQLRGTVGIVALVSLLWSASSVLTVLARNINRAWPEAKPRGYMERRLLALGMVGGLAVLLFLSAVLNALLDVLARFRVPLGVGFLLNETSWWTVLLGVMPRLFAFVALMGLYRWVPNTKVRWSEAFCGALVATPAGEIATSGFAWYLGSGIPRYELVYGSLGTVVAMMLWIYIGVWITLFGAHIVAAVARHSERDA